MAGINKIIEIISRDSQAQCESLIFDAQTQAAAIKKEAAERAEAEKQKMMDEASKECENIIKMAESGAEFAGKETMLKTRIDIINETIDAALAKLESLPDDKYFEALYSLAAKYALPGKSGEMLLSEKDLARKPEDFDKKLAAALQKGAVVTLGKKSADIKSGFILSYGDIEMNCTFSALIAESRDELKDLIYRKIFA